MKNFGVVAALAPLAAAFPGVLNLEKRATTPAPNGPLSQANAATAMFEPVPMFDAATQYINVAPGSGHEFVAPGPNDLRGPCPGLNAFANHGFLPHDGYATAAQFLEATMAVVGMGPQLASFLAVLGATIDGSGIAWSIGGTPPASDGILANKGNGISASHNKYESDVSPLRPDLYEYGNDYTVVLSQAQELFAITGGDITLANLAQFRAQRFTQSINNNPDFFNGPFTGVLVQPAAYTFIYRFMANHSEANPHGLLSHDTFMSWFSLSETDGKVSWTPGHERIPDYWYRRPTLYPYDNEYFFADVANMLELYPMFADVGGNLGKTNSFAGLNIANLTGGVYNSESFTQGNNFACFAYEASTQVKPDVASASFSRLEGILGQISSQFACPKLEKIDQSQLEQFPGYSRSGVAPT